MASLTLRVVKGSPLTNVEIDNNFSNINTETVNNTANIGILSQLTTTAKANLVSAVNEVSSNVISISRGGTGQTTKAAGYNALTPITTLGDIVYGDGTNSATRLAGNTTTTKKFLTQTGTGSVSAAPGWNGIADGDLPSALTGKTYNGLTLTANATGFQIAGGTTSKTLVISNNLTFSGTDGSTLNIGSGGTLGTGAYATIANYLTTASAASTYLPLTGGTLTGVLNITWSNASYMTPVAFTNSSSGGGKFNISLFGGSVGSAVAGDALWSNDVGSVFISPNAAGKSIKLIGGAWTNTPGITIDGNNSVAISSGATIGSYTALHANNYNNYSPTLTGGGASGTWGISITGNANYASSAGSVSASSITGQTGMYTSASRPGPYRLYRRDNDSDYSVQTYWTGTYWRLYGYSGDTSHADTYVGYADNAGYASSAGTAYGLNVHTGRNNEANKVVRTDSSGYLQTGYINSSNGDEGNNSNPSRVWGTNGTDSYLRTYLTSALSVNYAASAGSAGSATTLTGTQNDLGYSIAGQDISYAGQGGPEILGNSAGAAMMSFHRPGYYAINLGLGTDNQLRTGGWSRGSSYVVLDSGNYSNYAVPLSGGTMSGQLYIRNTTPTIYFQDTDNYTAMLHCNSNVFYVLRGATDSTSWSQVGSYWPMELDLSNNNAKFGGTIWAAGDITAYSDERVKANWSSLPADFVSKLSQIKSGTFDRTDVSGRHVGVSAQSLQTLLPEAVVLDEKQDLLSVSYGNAALAACIELAKEVVELKERIKQLEASR